MLVGDVHLSDRPPSVRTETYADDILAKLTFCVEFANANADVMVLLGDVFHLKAPSKTSHRLVVRTAEVLEGFNGRVLIVPGNHDLSQDRLESLPSQPLGALALHPNIELIDGLDPSTGIFGIPYLHDIEKMKWLATTADAGTVLIATHASIFPPGLHPPYEHVNADAIDTHGIPLAYGHIHDPHGFYQVGEAWFCNNGAISRGSLHEETVKREPAVTLFDSEVTGCPFESIPVPFRPAEQVFRLAEVVERQEAQGRLDDFLSQVGEVSLTSISVEEVVAHARTTDLPQAALDELEDIISHVL